MSRGSLRSGLFLAAFLIPAWAALAAEPPRTPKMVADLNTQPVNGSALPLPDFFDRAPRAELGGVLFFAAVDPMHGQELWRSDGTPEGTWLVRDIRPGRMGAGINNLIAHQGRLYFFANDGVWGLELWTSNGSREGTRLVRDVCPGSCWVSYQITHEKALVSAGSQLFFPAGRYGDLDLWRSDGTRDGTRRVIDTCPGCNNQLERNLTPLPDGRLFFTAASNPQVGSELWVSDGTPQGTRELDLSPGFPGSGPSNLFALGNRVLFWTGSDTLWVSDGTVAGSQVVRSSLLLPSWEPPVVWKDAAYFANNFGELWRTDGTPGGTTLLRTFGTAQSAPYYTPNHPTRLTPLKDSLLFIAWDPSRGAALWQTRGTPSTTRVLRDPVPGADSPDLAGLRRVGNRGFFFTRRAEGPFDLWVSDGKATGTRRLTTLCQTAGECVAPGRHDLLGVDGLAVDGLAFFPVHSKGGGSELWRSDGSAGGTFQVRDIHSGPGSSALGEVAALDGRAVFSALTTSPTIAPANLWSSDGTAAGTVPVEWQAHWPQDFVRQGNHLYFSGAGLSAPGEPFFFSPKGFWRTDGTAAGTERLADLFNLDLLALDGSLLFLQARDAESPSEGTGTELWRSDGTPAGTRLVVDLDQQGEEIIGSPSIWDVGSSHPGPPVRLGPILLFAADDGLSGRELWATNGTSAGTRKVRDINQQDEGEDYYFVPGESYPEFLVRLGGKVLFVADDGLSGRELWVTDGTEAGTRQLRDLRPGAEGSAPHDLVELGGLVYFFASVQGVGEALWQTDGTAAGTVQVKSLALLGYPSWGRELTRAGSRLFFVADNEVIGPELHVSNGTLAGTRLVRQIRTGVNGSYPQSFKVVDGVLIFAADDGAHGLEPWRSDGTAAGTWRLGDLAPGQAASAPTSFSDAGSLLFFAADDGAHGRELWVMDRP